MLNGCESEYMVVGRRAWGVEGQEDRKGRRWVVRDEEDDEGETRKEGLRWTGGDGVGLSFGNGLVEDLFFVSGYDIGGSIVAQGQNSVFHVSPPLMSVSVPKVSGLKELYDAVNGGGDVWINENKFRIVRQLGEGGFAYVYLVIRII
ncbi:hypothetical protein Vadar_027405 [Vaccinium darrowii]|uniref:Uncharacterized protein n=1 Tax=Vaccinium darrowii TaxID=229202 RepID=A0ACB7XLG5_9ERIC|nr:hypothetical protein Vadar_027405 [Vaccinium darrowii]